MGNVKVNASGFSEMDGESSLNLNILFDSKLYSEGTMAEEKILNWEHKLSN